MTPETRKKIVIVVIAVLVGGLHLVTGPDYSGPYPAFVNGYLIDILLPMAVYLLLCARELPGIRQWWMKGLIVFGIGVVVETAQYFDLNVLGETFDPVDYVMYGMGVGLAIGLDVLVLPRVLPFWEAPELLPQHMPPRRVDHNARRDSRV